MLVIVDLNGVLLLFRLLKDLSAVQVRTTLLPEVLEEGHCYENKVVVITAVKTLRAFAMCMLIYIVGVVVIERALVIGARQFSAMCFGATERVYNAS